MSHHLLTPTAHAMRQAFSKYGLDEQGIETEMLTAQPVATDKRTHATILRSEEEGPATGGVYFVANESNGVVITTLTAHEVLLRYWRGHLKEL